MSISPPTDIVLDVARAADPTRYKQAVAKLGPTAGADSTFSQTLTAEAAPPTGTTKASAGASAPTDATAGKTAETYRKFEAMALANLIEASMPKDSSFFGKGVAGDTWKSLLVEQMADQMAQHGGIGLATQMSRAALARNDDGAPPGPAAGSMITNTMDRVLLKRLDDTPTNSADKVL